MIMSPAKTAELIEMLLGVWTEVGPRSTSDGGEHWRHLANTTEESVCDGDVAFCRVTLTISFQSFRTVGRNIRPVKNNVCNLKVLLQNRRRKKTKTVRLGTWQHFT